MTHTISKKAEELHAALNEPVYHGLNFRISHQEILSRGAVRFPPTAVSINRGEFMKAAKNDRGGLDEITCE
jgi:hypothetical protein